MKKLLFLLAFLSVFAKTNAQWTQGGNDGNPPYNIFDLDSFYLTLNGYGIQKSIDYGQSWNLIHCPAVLYKDLIVKNGRIITSTDKGVYISDDFGATWQKSNSGISSPGNVYGNSLIELPNSEIIYSNGSNGLFKSTTNGSSWTPITGSPTSIRGLIFDPISNLMVCATQTGIYVSSDLGLNWTAENSGLSSINLILLEYLNGVWMCFSANNNIFVSYNNTFQWSMVSGLTGTYMNPALLTSNNLILANRTTGVHVFNFNTNQFELSTLNQSFPVVIADGLNQIFYGGEIVSNKPDYYNSTYTNDFGLTWNYIRGIRNSAVLGFSQLNNDKLSFDYAGAGCYSASLDSSYYIIGAPYVFGSVSGNISNSLKYQNQKFYAATNSGIWISNDSAQTWAQHTTGLPQTPPSNYYYTYDLEVFGDTIVVSTDQGPFISTNGGNSFSMANFPGSTSSNDLLYHNGKLYSAGTPKMLVSTNLGANWAQFGSQTAGFRELAASGPYIYSASDQSIHMTIDTIGITTDVTGTLDLYIGQGNNPGIAAYDTLLFVSNFYNVGVQKMNVNQPGVYINISDNLPFYELSPGNNRYPYMDGTCNMTIFDNKLWLGTAGMSCFTRPLSDFGYPPVVVTNDKNKEQTETPNTLNIFPNPATQQIKISGLLDNSLLQIYGLQGELIQSIQTSGNTQMWIDVSLLAKGIYFVNVYDVKGNISKGKFIKN